MAMHFVHRVFLAMVLITNVMDVFAFTPAYKPAFKPCPLQYNKELFQSGRARTISNRLVMTDSSQLVVSLLSGSIAGAIGLGVAYPFDSVKTKAQTLSVTGRYASKGLLDMMSYVYKTEGIQGFYYGVGGTHLSSLLCCIVIIAPASLIFPSLLHCDHRTLSSTCGCIHSSFRYDGWAGSHQSCSICSK